jgi:hypothetical protein
VRDCVSVFVHVCVYACTRVCSFPCVQLLSVHVRVSSGVWLFLCTFARVQLSVCVCVLGRVPFHTIRLCLCDYLHYCKCFRAFKCVCVCLH